MRNAPFGVWRPLGVANATSRDLRSLHVRPRRYIEEYTLPAPLNVNYHLFTGDLSAN
jgi:hypothetical protein